MTALAADALKPKLGALHVKAALVGSFMPDVPLLLLSVGGFVVARLTGADERTQFARMFDQLYFNDPFWIAACSLWHAPLMIALQAAIGWLAHKRGLRWGRALLWFCASCALHSLVDILTHVNDGPVMFFPFDWRYRWPSPVSYWDRRHLGSEFGQFELVFNGLMLAYFAVRGAYAVRAKRVNGRIRTSPTGTHD